ncbi:hypothetical protein MMC29_002429 [Sticta canariensis]|nr:hypothetical protein [Sticta canariensis]
MVSDLVDLTSPLRSLKFISDLELDLERAVDGSVVCPLLEILDLSHLQKLRLACCPHSPSPSVSLKFSEMLFSDYFPVTLTHLTLRFVNFLDNYLQLDDYPSLTHLDLGYSKTVQYLVDAVDRHKDTLKYLLVHHFWRKLGRLCALFDAKLFDVIKKCKNLSQLGISLYKTKMVDFCKGLLEELPSLVTLIIYFQIHSAKRNFQTRTAATSNTDQYSEVDARIANQVMSGVSASSKFSVFAFLESRVSWDRYDTLSMQRQCFVRRRNPQDSSAQSGSGDEEELVIRTEARTAKYLVSECDLMDISHQLTLLKDFKYQRRFSRGGVLV